jgi:hypothetical protein
MTTEQKSGERKITAFLGNPDRPDIGNAIHSTDGAKEYGYQAALVGGATVWGWASPAILDALGTGWLDHGWVEIAFRRPTYPDDELTITVTPEAGHWLLRITAADGHDRITGELGLGDAPWLGTLTQTPLRPAEPEMRVHPTLTPEIAPIGRQLAPLGGPEGIRGSEEFVKDHQEADHPLFRGPGARLHPAWVAARPIRVLHHTYDYGPAIHAKSHIQWLAPAAGTPDLVTTATFHETYERKGHHYGIFDCSTYDGAGRELIRQRHTTVFAVAKRGTTEG